MLSTACAKVRDSDALTDLAKKSNQTLSNTGTTPEVANGAATLPDRVHVYAIKDTKLDASANEHGTTVIFNKVGVNSGNAYSTDTGAFTAPHTGYYRFDYSLLWLGSQSVTSDFGICEAFLYVTGAPFPVMMNTAVARKGLPCNVQGHVEIALEQGQAVYVAGMQTLPGLVQADGQYVFAYFVATENKL